MYLFMGGAGPEPPKQEGKEGAKAEGGAKTAAAAPAQAPSSSSRPKKDE